MNDPASPPGEPTIGLLTMSYRGDLELCRLLCETVDRFVPHEFPHILAVPKADHAAFVPLAGAGRQLIAQEDLLPRWIRRVPLPGPGIRRLLRLPRRNVYITDRLTLLRGWIVQQMMKMAAAARSGSEVIVHVDSDVAFVRPLRRDHIVQGGKVRLLRHEGAGNTGMHHPWHLAASQLLGLPVTGYHGSDYIGNLTIWRRSMVQAMLEKIERVMKNDCMRALATMPEISEYILYGVFCEHVVGFEQSGHFGTERLLCATVWPGLTDDALASHLSGFVLEPDQVAIGVQSTIPLPIEARRKIVDRLISDL